MALVLIRRVVWMIPIVLGVSLVVFSMMHLAPGDPAEAILGPRGTEELLRKARKDLGLDRPLYVQYGSWVIGAAQGDLGESYRLNRAVMPEVLAKLKNSAYLASIAFVVAVLAGIAVGASSAVRRGGLLDNLLMASTVTGISMPPFYLGMLLIILFSVKLDLLPTGGMYDVRQDPSNEQLAIHLILPT
ncbi:MAG: peptide/nickel transport system permease protein, partial [Thermomicrobiales bacterium]|nr:peptide/nickel transport system permease protein [Thermomicrobiales bacterium]